MSEYKVLSQSEPGTTMFTSFRRKLHKRSKSDNKNGLNGQYESVRKFEVSLTLLLESLKSKEDEGMLCLRWLEHALIVALEKHKEAESLIPDLQLPVSESDEKWMNEYLDETTKILDMCNALTARISVLEHSQLLVRYSIHTLEKPVDSLGREDMERARKSLLDWCESVASKNDSSSVMKKERYTELLKSMIDGLKPPKEKTDKKVKAFLYALCGAKAATFLVCAVLARAFSQEDDILDLKLQLSDQFLWSTSVINLLQHAKEEACERVSMGSVTCLLELDNADKCVRKALVVLDEILEQKFPLTAELVERLVSSIQDLSSSVSILGEGLDRVGKKISEFFHMIVHSRSILLDHIAGSYNAVCT